MALPAFPTAIVAFLAALNGNPFDASTNPEGLADGGHRPNFPLAMNSTADLANYFATLGTALVALADQVAADADSAANGSGTESAVANIRAGTSAQYLSIRRVLAANEPVALTRATTTLWNMATGLNFDLVLNGNVATLANPTNQVAGKSGVLRIKQDATGGRTLAAYGSNFRWLGGAPALPVAPEAEALVSYFVWSDGRIYLTYGGDDQ